MDNLERGASRGPVKDVSRRKGIAILLCSHFGERFIGPQLDSIAAQTRRDWALWVSDDQSLDRTLEIVASYRQAWGARRLSVRAGPDKGFCVNFLSLACDPVIRARYYAYCDQDDLWDPDKLAVATSWLDGVPPAVPALYCGRTRIVDEAGRPTGYSPLFSRPVGFRNALVQSVAGGNTMVFNNAARELLIEAGPGIDVQTHDWWTYIVVSACGGRVFYDPRPTVGYRQHPSNLVGSNASVRGRAERAVRLLRGRFRSMNDRNIAALKRIEHRLTRENAALLEAFERARQDGFLGRVAGVCRTGVYCHTRLGNLGLFGAALLKKL